MGGLLIAALGLGVLGWHLRSRDGRRGMHPRILKTAPGSAVVWVIGTGGLLIGGRGLAAEFGIAGPLGLGVVVAAALVALAGGSAHRARVAALAAQVERQRAAYPDLDEEALYRFVVADRHPQLSRRQVEEITLECGGVEDLARRLAPWDAAREKLDSGRES